MFRSSILQMKCREVRIVWISRKKWKALEKRVADLEGEIRSQPKYTAQTIADRLKEILLKQTLQRPSGDSLKNG